MDDRGWMPRLGSAIRHPQSEIVSQNMLRQGIFHLFFFAVFFSIGALSLGVAVLCDDFVQYGHNKHLVKQAESSVERLPLNADYDTRTA
jgi:hypothetical protein